MSDSLFKALADPTRRDVLRRLQRGPATAGELAEEFPQAKATLSHHFNVLKAAGLVRSERRGQHVVYSLNTSVFEDLARMMADLFKPERKK
ncbi:autorepressor SdpR family transcription factor [Wenzhouxiangella sp. XN24]|uniref:autorepressor SdpR family transcription factor n=1 Tax=Wenzhouxiangella sp. XN24 TaxID=2713569 RepID=UPI0013EC98BD|nr:autorepressor SdpR family transcription factor [Wenzhouxiangella sp. XN24]NGX17588.1 winged helix-turn-helix transcriptional regulator [Wenzhouxiangella sp. XN24]